jgi:hypothetical protein
MQNCQLCCDLNIPDKIYEVLDLEAIADDELIICAKCVAGIVRNKEATLEIKIKKSSAVLGKVLWDGEERREA